MAESYTMLRSKLFTNILNSILSSTPTRPSEARESISALRDAFSLACLVSGAQNGTAEDVPSALQLEAGLTEMDIRRFTPSSDPMLDVKAQTLIAEEIDSVLQSIANFWNSSTPGFNNKQEPSSQHLCHDIQTRLDKIETSETEAGNAYDRIQLLLETIQEIHPRLQQQLTHALEKIPPEIESRRSASNDLLAMTIETSLVKVSLIRAQVLELVYGYSSPKDSELNMRDALSAAYTKLKEDERKLEEEELILDRQLAEYQTLLDMVDDGGSGGFRQIVQDTARVEKETEECRRDLRRLGWTGETGGTLH
ncbi:CBM1 domain-containing protein [Mycena sanguinolenta]|uniref:CBM1 domain-containing protein n=1 Tax=Mycena sanguinolenta TaxID=230812 RepID=A0A8H6Z1T5_9AGAR|nr:CBM1 domain-containing protein [Mycena sanguinolenta]